MLTPVEASRFMQRYAKEYAAGAFAMPTRTEIEQNGIRQWGEGDTLTLAAERTLTRPSKRRDWTGTVYEIPAGAHIATHIARAPDAPVPDLDVYDLIYTYREDQPLARGLQAQGRTVWATGISAASEIVTVWSRAGSAGPGYRPADLVTVASAALPIDADLQAAALAEVTAADSWHDDFPYYSDGSWRAISLRGFRADDPTWGVKPAEMGRKWQAEHPGALDYRCEWTTYAARCPALVSIVEASPHWTGLERVRLMRMDATKPNGKARVLRRHTDITDKAAGTRDGQIVRWHVPIVTDPRIVMHNWDLDGRETRHHLAAWTAWYIDARKPHAVTNPTDVNRVHLVIDAVADPAARAAILAARLHA